MSTIDNKHQFCSKFKLLSLNNKRKKLFKTNTSTVFA